MSNKAMPNAFNIMEKYRSQFGSKGKTRAVDQEQEDHLKAWIKDQYGIEIPNRFIFTNGSGGGQKYRILYNIYDVYNNAGKPCVYYIQASKDLIADLNANGHTPLENLIKGQT